MLNLMPMMVYLPGRHLMTALVCIGCCLLSARAEATLRFHWEADFPAETQAKLRTWLNEAFAALEQHVGALPPMPVHVHIHRRAPAAEPVPWANTRHGRVQAE